MTLTPEQLKEIEERSEKSGWDDIHGYEAVKLHQDHEALLEEVRRVSGLEAPPMKDSGRDCVWESLPGHDGDHCTAHNRSRYACQATTIARLQEALIEERAAKIETQRSLAFAEGYDYTLPNPLPTAQDQARTELQSEGRIPK